MKPDTNLLDTGHLPSPPTHDRRSLFVIWFAAFIFLVLGTAVAVSQYHTFRVTAFDFGIFDQGLWLLSNGETPFITVRGLHLLGDHSSYLMYLLAPLYWAFPYQELLMAVAVAVLAAGAPLTYSIARRFGARAWPAAAVGIAYLLHPALAWSARDNFHPELFVIPLVLAGFLLIQHERALVGSLVIGLSLLAKEDVALLLVPLGLYMAVVMGRRWVGYSIAALATLAFVVQFTFLLPHFSPTGDVIYGGRYDHIGEGVGGLVSGILTSPGTAFTAIVQPNHLGYVAAMVLPMPLALFAPRLLAIGFPTYLANILSTHTYQAEIRWHYTTYLIVAIALASARGAARFTDRSSRIRSKALGVTLIAALGFNLALGPNPVPPLTFIWEAEPTVEAMTRAVGLIPDDSSVSAMSPFVSHLSHRSDVYLFPNPWERRNYGASQMPELPDPDTIDWVLVRTDRYEDLQGLVRELRGSGEFAEVFREGPVLVLRR